MTAQNDINNYIDTLILREQIFFKDGGVQIRNKSYSKRKATTSLEYTHSFTADDGVECKEYTLYEQELINGGRLYKTHKSFVNEYGFAFYIKCPFSLARQQVSDYDVLIPIKCYLTVTIPSLLELRKTTHWDKYIVSRGTNKSDDDISGYIQHYINFEELRILEWSNEPISVLRDKMKINDARFNGSYSKYVSPLTMELAQMDFCVNTIDSDVNTLYNLLKYAGEYGTKNMKLYHNNTEGFDAEYTVGNYKDRDTLITKVQNNIMTKANGLEFRRGAKSSQIIKFYDYTRRAMKYQQEHYLPIYVSRGDKDAIDNLGKYYGKTIEEITKKKSTLRYEVSIRNIIGGNKGVKKTFEDVMKKKFRKITLKHLYNPKYRGIVRTVLRNYLYNIFGDEITKNKISIGGKNMNKWDLVKEEKFQKGLQIMAILQLTEGDNGMSIAEIKKKCIESGANYESVRRLFKIIKDKGYTSSWDNDRITAMNLIKDIYKDLEKVN